MSFWDNIFSTLEPTVEYCEQPIAGLIARPGYFVSNLPFFILGIYLIFQKGKLSKIFGIFSIFIGLASAIYDASFRYYAQVIDLNVMFAFVNFLLILNLSKLIIFTRAHQIRLFLEIQGLYLLLLLIFKGGVGSLIFGLTVLGLLVTQIIIWKQQIDVSKGFWITGFAIFILGWIIWQFDANQILCDPNNILNGRGVFHLLNAITIFMIYKHYNISNKHNE